MAATPFDTRYVLSGKESTTYGSLPGSPNWYAGEVDDESIASKFEVIDRKDMSRYGQAKTSSGKEFSEGSVNWALQSDDFMGNALVAFWPTDTVGSDVGGGKYPHVFTEAGTAYPTFTLKVGRSDYEHTYTGWVWDRFSLSASLNEYVACSMDGYGKVESAPSNTLSSPSFADTADAMHFVNATVKFNDNANASSHVKACEFEVSLNRDTDNACGLGSNTYTRAPPVQLREMSGSIEFNKSIVDAGTDITSDYEEPSLKNLTNAATDRVYNPGSGGHAIELMFTDGAAANPNYLKLELYKVQWQSPESSVSGRDTQTMRIPFKVLLDAGDANAMSKATLQGAATGAY